MHKYGTCKHEYDVSNKFDSQDLGGGSRDTESEPSQGYKVKYC